MSEREEQSGVALADADSLLGMLQRGRGKGYLMALEAPPEEVWPLLFECVTNDPRFNEQWSPDEEYYASLILKTGMHLGPLLSFVRRSDASEDEDWSCYYPLTTLRCLAHRGSRQALDFLREYVEEGSDFRTITVFIVDDLAKLRALKGIDEILYHRINDDPDNFALFRKEVEEAWTRYYDCDEEQRQRSRFFLPMYEPWKSRCDSHSGFAGLFKRVEIPCNHSPAVHRMSEGDLARLCVADLLASVDETGFSRHRLWYKQAIMAKASAEDEDRLLTSLSSDNKYRVRLALCGLGKLGTPKAFDAVKSYLETSENADSGVRGDAFDAIKQMPGLLTLAMARQWFGRSEWYLQVAAGRIFEHHATLDDAPLLIQVLRTPETIEGKDSRLPFAVRALGRFEGYGRIPELERVFCEVGDPYDRGSAAKAMAATSAEHFRAEYAFECLWDSDWPAFKTGCAMVDLSTAGAVERLRKVVADPYESEGRREVAKERLETAA